MPRVKNGPAHHARKAKIMKAAKGAWGGRSKLYKAAKETVERGMRYAYRDRRKKKGEFRMLWITRIGGWLASMVRICTGEVWVRSRTFPP